MSAPTSTAVWGPFRGIDRSKGIVADDSAALWDAVDCDLGAQGELRPRPAEDLGPIPSGTVYGIIAKDGVMIALKTRATASGTDFPFDEPPGTTQSVCRAMTLMGDAVCALIGHYLGAANQWTTRLHVMDGVTPSWVEDPAGPQGWWDAPTAGGTTPGAWQAAGRRATPRCMQVAAGKLWCDNGAGGVITCRTGNARAWDLRTPAEIERGGERYFWEVPGTLLAAGNVDVPTTLRWDDWQRDMASVRQRWQLVVVEWLNNSGVWMELPAVDPITGAYWNGGAATDGSVFIRLRDFNEAGTLPSVIRFRMTILAQAVTDAQAPTITGAWSGSDIVLTIPAWSGKLGSTAITGKAGSYTIVTGVGTKYIAARLLTTNPLSGAATVVTADTYNVTSNIRRPIDATFDLPLVRVSAASVGGAITIDPITPAIDQDWLAGRRAFWAKQSGARSAGYFPVSAGDSGGDVVKSLVAVKDRLLVVYDAASALLLADPDPQAVRILEWSRVGSTAVSDIQAPVAVVEGMALLPSRGGYTLVALADQQLSSLRQQRLAQRLGDLARPADCLAMLWWESQRALLIFQRTATPSVVEAIALHLWPEFEVVGLTRWNTQVGWAAGWNYWPAILADRAVVGVTRPSTTMVLRRWDPATRNATWTAETTRHRLGQRLARKRLRSLSVLWSGDPAYPTLLIEAFASEDTTVAAQALVPQSSQRGKLMRLPITVQMLGWRINGVQSATVREIAAEVLPLGGL